MAEKKHRHLLEIARALLYSAHVIKYLWGEDILTAAFLINRIPSRVLNFQTPINVFKQKFPTSRLLTDIPLKVFGCTVFVHNHSLHCGKLDPRAHKCVFVGYTPTQKGFKCFDPISQKFFVTMDVTLFEN